MKLKFKPGKFSDIYDSDLGKKILEFLTEHDNVIRMITACELARPPAEAIASRLKEAFGKAVLADRIKQFTGHAIKQVVGEHGFEPMSKNIKVIFGGVFSRATKYCRTNQCAICSKKLPQHATQEELNRDIKNRRLRKYGRLCSTCAELI